MTRANQDAFVKEAAFLKREFRARNKYIAKSETDALYLFDSDIVVRHCAPWKRLSTEPIISSSVWHKKRFGRDVIPMTSLARRDNESPIELSRWIDMIHFAEAILTDHSLTKKRFGGLQNVMQLEVHYKETREIYLGLKSRLRDQRTLQSQQAARFRNDSQLLRAAAVFRNRHLQGVSSENPAEPASRDALVQDVLTLLQMVLQFPRGQYERRVAEWDRFIQLTARSGTIRPVLTAQNRLKDDGHADLAYAVSAFDEDELTDDERSKRNHIMSRLETVPSWPSENRSPGHEKSKANLDKDAIGLSHLHIAYSRLKERGAKQRIVFVTGSRRLVNMAYELCPRIVEPTTREVYDFAERSVRHASAYVAEALVEVDPEQKADFGNWLDGLLVFSGGGRAGETSEQLTQLASGSDKGLAGRIDGRKIERAQNDWETMIERSVRAVRAKRLTIPPENSRADNAGASEFTQAKLSDKIYERFKAVFKDSQSPAHFLDLLQEEHDRANDRLFTDLSEIGLEALISDKSGDRAWAGRKPPDLMLSNVHVANKIFQRLARNENYTQEELTSDYDQIKKELENGHDDRELSYVRYVVLGAAFARANNWDVALSQGQRALRILTRNERVRTPIAPKPVGTEGEQRNTTGREAEFLCASALATIAERPAELNEALAHLDRAEEKLKKDQAQHGAWGATTIRFDCERITVALSTYYMARSQDAEKGQIVERRSEYLDICTALERALSKLPSPYAKVKFTDENLGPITCMNLAMSIIQLAIIHEFRLRRQWTVKAGSVDEPMLRRALYYVRELAGDFVSTGDYPGGLIATRSSRCFQDAGYRVLALWSGGVATYAVPWEVAAKTYEFGEGDQQLTSHEEWRANSLREFMTEIVSSRV